MESNADGFNEMKDNLLNKTVFDILLYSSFGYLVAVPFSLLFKNKLRFCVVGAGIGAGVSYERNQGNFIKNWGWWENCHECEKKN